MITKKQKENYKKDPNHCPFCNSTDISYLSLEYPENIVYCQNCGKQWMEIVKIIDIKELN